MQGETIPDHNHEHFMRRALELARQGIALASPNPHVGAVIVDRAGQIVGEGFHTYEGMKHAEVLAIEHAGESACGGTLYLNLEPCCHTGRTGPCSDAVIRAGIARVYAAMTDPNPLVAGKSFARLRSAAIEVHCGLLQREARKLNELARETKVVTQMGNQGHSSKQYRTLVQLIQDGAIGKVKEAYTWSNRPIWPSAVASANSW